MPIPRGQRDWPRPLVWGQIMATYARADAWRELRGTGFPPLPMPYSPGLARGRPGPYFTEVWNLAQTARRRGVPRGRGPLQRIALHNYNRPTPRYLTQTFVQMGRSAYWTKLGMIVYAEGLDAVILKEFDYVTIEPHTVITAARDIIEKFNNQVAEKYPVEGRMTMLGIIPIFVARGFRTRDEALAFERRWWQR